MAKMKVAKTTILNNEDKLNDLASRLQGNIKQIWRYIAENKNANRSSGKTDKLHKAIVSLLDDALGDYREHFYALFTINTESTIGKGNKTNKIKNIKDIFDSDFNIDIKCSPIGSDDLHTAFLVKMPMTNLNKNRFNTVGGMFGEVARFYGELSNIKSDLFFVYLTPVASYQKTQEGKLKPEDVNYLGLNHQTSTGTVLNKLPFSNEIKDRIYELHIEYEIDFGDTIENLKTQDNLYDKIKSSNDLPKISITKQGKENIKLFLIEFLRRNSGIQDDE